MTDNELIERIAQRTAELVAERVAGAEQANGTAGFYSLAQTCARLSRSSSWVRRRKAQLDGRLSGGTGGRLMFPRHVIEEIVAGTRPVPEREDRALPAQRRAPRPRKPKRDDLLPVKGKAP